MIHIQKATVVPDAEEVTFRVQLTCGILGCSLNLRLAFGELVDFPTCVKSFRMEINSKRQRTLAARLLNQRADHRIPRAGS